MKKPNGIFIYIYIALWIISYLQDLLMIAGIVNQVVLVILMGISFYAFYEVNVHFKTCPYLKWLNVMLLILTIYGIIPIIGGWTLVGIWDQETIKSYFYIRNIYKSVLPIYAFYYFTLKRQISENNITYLFVALLAFSILAYYQKYVIFSTETGMEEITNNIGYYFVPLIPMLKLLRIRDVWKYLFLIICVIYILMAMKRGAILTGAVMLVLFLFDQFKGVSVKKASYLSILAIIMLIAAYQFTLNFYEKSSYFKSRLEQTKRGDSSFRDEIYTDYYEYFTTRTSPVEFLIGNGANATIAMLGEFAHNDWLEFAINQGVLGVIIYLIYWLLFFMEWKNYRGPTNCKQALGSLIVAYFMITLFSMSFDNMPVAATLCIGYCMAVSMRYRKIEKYLSRI